ncbi:MAG: SDR family NAD(P)-dependent oxidoreductase [Rhodobiaceae bacterium]|jgi:NAD(P)-dependent dehydrogenase (short-subunit alcohol dehydrogenase family)|nr:SDR family NAD(P)-dependent oxidoreductase [Rhodobiaceae bacterium]MBT7279941.1 SDR family NAD(P)-dependent oxidoreductase [Rhodobiaceae bacterium]MDG2496090.1 SDR family NAD(P)-dependent oxidoreductase [Alphaproteobacteria bacterium]
MRQLKNKVCVITGASSGIGAACAKAMAAQGAIVIGCDLRLDMLETVAEEINQSGGRMEAYQVDVSDRDGVFALADRIEKDHGGADVVLNNAGVAHSAPVEEITMDNFQWVMDIDFWGVVHGTQAFLPHMLKRGSGHIANVSSIFGLIGVPNQSAYNAAKFAVLGFTEALRHEMKEHKDIGVTCIHPGGINTNIVRHARFQQGPDADGEREEAIQRFQKLTITQPAGAAKAILKGIRKNKARVLIGPDAVIVDWARRLFPTHYMRVLPILGDIGKKDE